jgi:putative transcriptional regulator
MATLAGQFLVARPVLLDPNFRQSVVLLLEHGAEGAFGLVINRPRDVQGMSFTVFSGGPCQAQGLLMLHGHSDWAADHPTKVVAPGVFIGDAQCLKKINDVGDDDGFRFRVFTGYAGWGPGQLERELAAGAWVTVEASGELLFDIPYDEIWARLSPPRIPQFSLN